MEFKPSVSKSELSDTIDNFIKDEEKEVRFVSIYEKIRTIFKLILVREKGCRHKEGSVT